MSKRQDAWLETILSVFLVVVVVVNVGWMIYRYGGEHYYLRVGGDQGSFPLSLPVSVTWNGHTYRGTAVNAQGHTKRLTVKTVADNPGPFHRGEILRVTYNRHYGVTNYKLVRANQVPAGVRLAR
ncbi:YxeA family protein [Lactiplantibacillus garii]|nr:YxeA family protein [Lactiplantibacillus garii]